MVIYCDIDGTICTSESGAYDVAKPLKWRIEEMNERYYHGDHIIYWTARGTTTGVDWSEVTRRQFKEWGVKHHELRFNKPYYDLWIDDKGAQWI